MKASVIDIIIGKNQSHLTKLLPSEKLIHIQAAAAFQALQVTCQNQGFDLQIVSSYRDYQRQLQIWNLKAQGKRTLLDDRGEPLDFDQLAPQQIVEAITRWSAIPGFSRHHWGTDVDVYDANALGISDVRLVPAESEPGGVFYQLHCFIDELIAANKSFGWYRPFEQDLGGTAPEKWHLSYAPISYEYQQYWSLELFQKTIEQSEMLLKEIVLDRLDYYFEKCIKKTSPAPFPVHKP